MRGTFFSSVVHELRTPLNSIVPLVDVIISSLIRQSEIGNGHVLKLLKVIKSSSEHLIQVVEDALDVARIENNKFQVFLESFKFREAIDDVCSIMQFQIEQKALQL